MQDSSYQIDLLCSEYERAFQEFIISNRFFGNDQQYYDRCLERMELNELEVVVAVIEEQVVGYCLLNWGPKYAYFKKFELPEIQDLNVEGKFRRQGIGAAIIDFCEKYALKKGHAEMGIGVGLDSSFGAAQRLYARLGYIPDGQGISYDRKQVAVGEFRPIDENLCLMMTRKLK